MKVKFTLKPLQLEVEHTGGPRKVAPFRAEFRLYRTAMARVLAEVLDENARLRRGRGLQRRPLWLEAIVWYADRRLQAKGAKGPVLDRLAPGESGADASSGWHGGYQ